MLLGAMLAALYKGDLATLERLVRYGKRNNWIMGDGDITRTYFTPNLRKTLADLVYMLGGEDHYVMRKYPIKWTKGLRGFESHLQMLHIFLRTKINKKINEQMLARIHEHYGRNPSNALFSFLYHKYEDGDQTETLNIVLNEQWFPKDRLPWEKDRCGEYLWEREFGKNWKPCGKNSPHSGTDLLFVVRLLEESEKV
jgi:hypothetical protein